MHKLLKYAYSSTIERDYIDYMDMDTHVWEKKIYKEAYKNKDKLPVWLERCSKKQEEGVCDLIFFVVTDQGLNFGWSDAARNKKKEFVISSSLLLPIRA